jgi:hypothetical protein
MDHASPHECQQPECNPVIHIADERFNGRSRQPTHDRHEELKEAKVKGESESQPRSMHPWEGTRRKAHGKRIDGHAHGQQQEFDGGHVISS